MNFLNWLFGRAPKVTDAIPINDLPWQKADIAPQIDEPDEAETIPPDVLDNDQPLENLFCEIAYRDAKHRLTHRPITTLGIKRYERSYCLSAVCHMRRALRTFRLDRIEEVITADGEVLTPLEFVRLLGLDPRIVQPPASSEAVTTDMTQPHRQQRGLRDQIISPLTVLVACGRSDGRLHPAELDHILQWVDGEATHLHRAGTIPMPMLEEAHDLGRTIASMRPQASTLPFHMAATTQLDPQAMDRFFQALEAVIEADGQVLPGEVHFIRELQALVRNPDALAELLAQP